jgi:PPOX class probable F420-dependent enzyme
MDRQEKVSGMVEDTFAPLKVSDVAQLTTFRRNGEGVSTPVGIQFANGKLYFSTWSTTGKVKRLARNPRVVLAPFTKMGMKVIGPSVEGTARLLSEGEAAAVPLKKTLWGRLWNGIYRLRGWQTMLYEVLPVEEKSESE